MLPPRKTQWLRDRIDILHIEIKKISCGIFLIQAKHRDITNHLKIKKKKTFHANNAKNILYNFGKHLILLKPLDRFLPNIVRNYRKETLLS